MAKGRRLCSVPLVVSLGALLGLGIVVTLTSIHHQRLREDHGGGTRTGLSSSPQLDVHLPLDEMRRLVGDAEAQLARLKQPVGRGGLVGAASHGAAQWTSVAYVEAHHGYNSHEKNAGGALECFRDDTGAVHLRGTVQCEVNKVDCFATKDIFSVQEETQRVATLPAQCSPPSTQHVVAAVWRVVWGDGVNRGKIDASRQVRVVLRPDGGVVADLTNGLDDWVITFGDGAVSATGEGASKRPVHVDVPVPPLPSKSLVPVNRPMVAVGIPMTSRKLALRALEMSPLMRVALPSLVRSLPHDVQVYNVVLYAGYDDNDAFWAAKGPWPDRTEGGITIKFVQCRCTAMVCNTNCIMQRAYDDGALYFFRSNDDTALSKGTDWMSKFARTLAELDPPNLGVVGPDCGQGNTGILTHDFVHRTHLELFGGAYYPRSFTNWWCDDWISRTYGKRRTIQDTSVAVRHHAKVQRYKVDYSVKQPGGPYDTELAHSIAIVRTVLRHRNAAAPKR